MSEQVELAAVIGQLREELTQAAKDGEGAEFQFEVGPVELELSVAVSKEGGPNAKVKFWVVELGADARMTATNTQKIKLTLNVHRAGQPWPPKISGKGQHLER